MINNPSLPSNSVASPYCNLRYSLLLLTHATQSKHTKYTEGNWLEFVRTDITVCVCAHRHVEEGLCVCKYVYMCVRLHVEARGQVCV